jgi:hypothetical protein
LEILSTLIQIPLTHKPGSYLAEKIVHEHYEGTPVNELQGICYESYTKNAQTLYGKIKNFVMLVFVVNVVIYVALKG